MEEYRQISIEENYNKILNSGMFWEFYPELTGQWNIDKKLILPDVNFSSLIVKAEQMQKENKHEE